MYKNSPPLTVAFCEYTNINCGITINDKLPFFASSYDTFYNTFDIEIIEIYPNAYLIFTYGCKILEGMGSECFVPQISCEEQCRCNNFYSVYTAEGIAVFFLFYPVRPLQTSET